MSIEIKIYPSKLRFSVIDQEKIKSFIIIATIRSFASKILFSNYQGSLCLASIVLEKKFLMNVYFLNWEGKIKRGRFR